MGWQDDSRATNTLMSNFPHVSCWSDEISLSLGVTWEERVKSSSCVGNI